VENDTEIARDIREASIESLQERADDIRKLIIETVSRTGGHLAANLGVVEMTLALLHSFDPARDRLVWDVGHQTYAFKILTGRRDRFSTLRQYEGLSGFLRRDESECDAFGAGHAGTALSAALGMAAARDLRGGDEHVVAIVGDGAAGCGLSLTALNHIRGTTNRLIVALNDNEMSISENVGAISRHLGELLANPRYNRWKGSVESVADKMGLGWLRSTYYKVEEATKSLFLRNALFEEMGLRYVGPIDGHNLSALIDAMAVAKRARRPILLHIATQKGKGYAPAEKEPEKWHGTAAFDLQTGQAVAKPTSPSYSQVFGNTLEKLAAADERIVAVTAAMKAGTGLAGFARRFPARFFDVGIAEEHATVFAAGLATRGLIPVFAVYSTFMQRAVDCLIHDVCLQKLPVVFCLDRAGIVGDDGPTHHGVFDIALLRCIPDLIIMQPSDEAELARMLAAAVRCGRPVVIRYPRGCGPGVAVPDAIRELEIGRARAVRQPPEANAAETAPIQIWALGDMLPLALETAQRLHVRGMATGVTDARFVRPLDETLLREQAQKARAVVFVENGIVRGGFGSEGQEALLRADYRGTILRYGWPDEFIPQGDPQTLYERYGLTACKLESGIVEALGAQP